MTIGHKGMGLISRLWNETRLSRLRFLGLAALIFVPQATYSVLIQNNPILANGLIAWLVVVLTSGALLFPIRGRVRDLAKNTYTWTWLFIVLFVVQYLIVFLGQIEFLAPDDARGISAGVSILMWVFWLCLLLTPGGQKSSIELRASETSR